MIKQIFSKIWLWSGVSWSLSHFDQFEIIRNIPFRIYHLDISITNSSEALMAVMSAIIGVCMFNVHNIIPNRWQTSIEIIYETMLNTIKDNTGKEGLRFFPFILTLFLFIAVTNLFGLIPYNFSPTAHVAVTFGFSLSIFIAVLIIGLTQSKFNYISMFMPAGAPLVLGPILILVEMISHFAKPLSLGLRLAANITAGHLLLTILASFVWVMINKTGLLVWAAIFPFFVCLFISTLELAVAVIQAYVFCLLTIIYIGESLHPH